MAKPAAQIKVSNPASAASSARVIDIRTRQPWRPPTTPAWPFLLDVALIFSLTLLGAWLYLKMQGG